MVVCFVLPGGPSVRLMMQSDSDDRARFDRSRRILLGFGLS